MGKSLIRKTRATIPAWLILRDDWTTYRSGPLRTFALLSLMTDQDNTVTVSYAQLAETAETENRTLIRHIDHLCAIGAVTRRSGDRVNANTYTLHMDGPAPAAANGAEL